MLSTAQPLRVHGASKRPSPHAPTITACRIHLLVCNFYVQSLWLATLPRPLPSRPSLAARITADVAVVGGGFTGLWTAYHLTRLAPALRVVVLEAKHCGFGASGRNGGWVSAECVWGLMCLVHFFRCSNWLACQSLPDWQSRGCCCAWPFAFCTPPFPSGMPSQMKPSSRPKEPKRW